MTTNFTYSYLQSFTKEVFLKMGMSEQHAITASEVLLSADLRGIDSHGVARLIGYVRLWEKKRANANAQCKVVHETLSTAVVDGDSGLGMVAGPYAMQLAIDKAKHAGTGWVAVRNSNHFGIAGYYTLMAVENDMIGFSMTNASPLVSPTFSKDRLLGTNPISFAAPANQEPPIVVDMATTTAANGKLEILQRKGKDAPVGWMQDKEGNASTNSFTVKDGGALLPLGSDYEHGSHKGYCLGLMVDILSAVLSGANYGPWVPPFVAFLEPKENLVGEGIGHFFGAMRVDAFRPAEEFKRHMDNWIRTFRNSQTVKGRDAVIIPGDPERNMETLRKKEGIPLLKPVIDSLKEVGDKFGIAFKG